MILVIDVGNTNMTLGVYAGETAEATFRMMTKTPRTSDEYGVIITQLLKNQDIDVSKLEGSIIASVVPDVMHSLTSALIRYTKTKPLIVGPGVKTGIKVVTEEPRAIGADRIVDAVAAYEKYGGPVLVLDFGTATTYDLITEKGGICGGHYRTGYPHQLGGFVEGDGKAAQYRDQKAQVYSGPGDHKQYAGGIDVRTDRTDGVHHQKGEGRERSGQSEGGCHRRAGQNYLR